MNTEHRTSEALTTLVAPLQRGADGAARRPYLFHQFLAAIAFLLLFLTPLHAQPANFTIDTNVVLHAGRYLFIVETTTSTRRMSANIQKAVTDVVTNDLARQLRPGDTIGLWTYNQSLHLGQFPLQHWSLDSRFGIASNMVDFISRQKFEKTPNFDAVFSSLADLVQESEKLTIFIISAGDEPMVGSPFDALINASYTHNRADLKKQDLPFITLLRSWHGDIIGGSVCWEPWTIDFPKFPADPKKVAVVKLQPPVAQPRMGKPLIVIGTPPPPTLAPAPEIAGPLAVTTSSPPAVPAEAVLPAQPAPTPGSESQGEVVSVRPVEPIPASPPPQASPPETPAPPVAPLPRSTIEARPPVANPVVPSATPASVAAETPPQNVAANPAPANPAVQTGVVMPPFIVPLELLLVALSLLTLAVVLGLYLIHRSRVRQSSLITSSLERQKK